MEYRAEARTLTSHLPGILIPLGSSSERLGTKARTRRPAGVQTELQNEEGKGIK